MFYSRERKVDGMDVSYTRKLKSLEAENTPLKKLLAGQMPDNAMLNDVNSKKCRCPTLNVKL